MGDGDVAEALLGAGGHEGGAVEAPRGESSDDPLVDRVGAVGAGSVVRGSGLLGQCYLDVVQIAFKGCRAGIPEASCSAVQPVARLGERLARGAAGEQRQFCWCASRSPGGSSGPGWTSARSGCPGVCTLRAAGGARLLPALVAAVSTPDSSDVGADRGTSRALSSGRREGVPQELLFDQMLRGGADRTIVAAGGELTLNASSCATAHWGFARGRAGRTVHRRRARSAEPGTSARVSSTSRVFLNDADLNERRRAGWPGHSNVRRHGNDEASAHVDR